MQIKRGNDRLVVLLPALCLAIKFPRIYWRNFWGTFVECGFSASWWYKELFKWSAVVTDGTMKHWLFRGIMNNWLEFIFYWQTKHEFLVPTYFSFFGLCNIQKLGISPKIEERDFYVQMVIITQDEAHGHHFCNPANFSYKDGKLQMLDYGDHRVQKVVVAFGKLIQDQFDINAKCPHDGIISGLRK
jgi:hypothetical protein